MSDTPRHAWVREPAVTLPEACELTHLAREPIDYADLLVEHQAYRRALTQLGLQVVVLPALPQFPDSVFVEDAALLLPELTVLTRPGVASRQAEPVHLQAALAARGLPLHSLQAPATLDGGDVLRIGKRLLVGLSTRSNAAAVEQLRSLLQPLGYQVDAVPLGPSLHLKTACTALDDETLLINPAWVDAAALPAFRFLQVDAAEPFAANVLRLPQAWLANAAYPRTLERLGPEAERRGISLHAVAIPAFGRAEAGLTCLSLIEP